MEIKLRINFIIICYRRHAHTALRFAGKATSAIERIANIIMQIPTMNDRELKLYIALRENRLHFTMANG